MIDCDRSNNMGENGSSGRKNGSEVRMDPQKPRRRRIAKALRLILGLGGVVVYLMIVFLAANTRSANYLRMKPKPGYSRPAVSDECRRILAEADLQPYGNKHPAEFREYGNVWAGDSAKTLMYKSSVLEHPQCLNVLMQEIAITNMRYILVIYDCERKSELLMIRNYK